nr:reverse transcriptase domain-containing protein [Tanacetum cinerariifolium]
DNIMARMDAITMKMDAQYNEMKSHTECKHCGGNHSIMDCNEDDTPMSYEEEAKFMQTFRCTRFTMIIATDMVNVLEDREGVATKQSRDDAPIKGRNINEGEAASERINNDSDEIARVLTFMDATTVLAGGINVPTGSGFIPTAGSHATVISTSSEALVKEYLSIRPATNDKEMELWVELKRMYKPDPEDQLWTLIHNFMHAPVEWKLYDLSGVHHVTAKDKEIFMLVEKDYPLRKGLALVMVSYKLQKEHQVYGRIVENKMHKAFPLPGSLRIFFEKRIAAIKGYRGGSVG